MGSTMVFGTLALLAIFVTIWLVGNKQKKRAEAQAARITSEVRSQNPHAEILGKISYHGGFPQMPKPSMLQLGLTGDGLLLYDHKGWSGRIYFRDWRGVEQFTILAKAGTIGKSTAILGPLVPYFFKDSLRYFIALKYNDRDYDENHLLFETDNKALQQMIYDALLRHTKPVVHGDG